MNNSTPPPPTRSIPSHYFRNLDEPALPGQPIDGCNVFGGAVYPSLRKIYWQRLNSELKVLWYSENGSFFYYGEDNNGQNFAFSRSDWGRFDDFDVWVPRYKQTTVLETLLKNEFSSIKPQEMYCLITLVGMADIFGVVHFTSIRKISDITGYSKDTTIRHVDSLKASKFIREKSKISKVKKKGVLQEKLPRKYEVILGYELVELDGVLFNELEDRMRK